MTKNFKINAQLKWNLDRSTVEEVKNGEVIQSKQLEIKLRKDTSFWSLQFYPKGTGGAQGKSVSMFIKCTGIENASERKVIYSLSFQKNGEFFNKQTSTGHMASVLLKGRGWTNFINFEGLGGSFVNDKLTIVADVTIDDCGNDTPCVTEDTTENHDLELLKKLKKAASFENLSDFTIICGDESFPCHKVILASRSEVFEAMFNKETEEKIENQVTVKDSKPIIVKVMLDYVYTGKLPENLDDICGDVLYLATKYNLPGLAKASEQSLFNTICNENALSTLVIIDRHCPTSNTRTNVIQYVAENILDTIDTQNWNRFAKEHPGLTTEVMKCVALKHTQVQKTEGKAKDRDAQKNEGKAKDQNRFYMRMRFYSI